MNEVNDEIVLSSKEYKALLQGIRSLKKENGKLQKQVNILIKENEKLKKN